MIYVYRSVRCFVTLLLLTACESKAGEPDSFKELQASIDRRVAERQPTAEERRFDQIGWCTSLLEAERLARQHQRPIFLFTHDGRMNVGRC